MKYQTASAAAYANGNELEVEVSLTDSTKTFVLGAPEVRRKRGEICSYTTPHEPLKSVKIKQTKGVDGWLIRSLQFPKRVGSPFYDSYAMRSNNEMFWVDKDSCEDHKNLGCCSKGSKEQCDLVLVTGGNINTELCPLYRLV